MPRKVLFEFFYIGSIPRTLGLNIIQAANLPMLLTIINIILLLLSLSYNCFFTDHLLCTIKFMYEFHFIPYHLVKYIYFMSLSLLFPRRNWWLERLRNLPGQLTSEWKDYTLDLGPSDSVIGTSNHYPKLLLWRMRSQSLGAIESKEEK